MFAESHYNKDMVLLSLTFSLFYYVYKLLSELTWKNLFMFALAGALALISKSLELGYLAY